MRNKAFSIFAFMLASLLLTAFPAFAGEWSEQEEGQWQYINDDGEIHTGWLELENENYYLDDEGYRINGRWIKISRYWYYFDEDGILATDTWIDNYHVDGQGRKDKLR